MTSSKPHHQRSSIFNLFQVKEKCFALLSCGKFLNAALTMEVKLREHTGLYFSLKLFPEFAEFPSKHCPYRLSLGSLPKQFFPATYTMLTSWISYDLENTYSIPTAFTRALQVSLGTPVRAMRLQRQPQKLSTMCNIAADNVQQSPFSLPVGVAGNSSKIWLLVCLLCICVYANRILLPSNCSAHRSYLENNLILTMSMMIM